MVYKDLSYKSLSFYSHSINNAPKLNPQEELLLIQKAQEGDIKARNILIVSHLPFIIKTALSLKSTELEASDLVSEGVLGFMNAIRLFNASSGFKLITYARLWIIQSIQRAGQYKGGLHISEKESKKNNISIVYIEDDSLAAYAPEEDVFNDEVRTYIKTALSTLDYLDRKVIILNYGLFGMEAQSLSTIAATCHLKRDQIAWIKKRAIQKLRLLLD